MSNFKPRILYFYGFNSCPQPEHPKIQILEEFGPVTIYEYDTFNAYSSNLSRMKFDVNPNDYDLFVGSCLGGFYALRLHSFLGIPCVAINPLLDPESCLAPFVDINLSNPAGRIDRLSQQTLGSYTGEKITEEELMLHEVPPTIGCSVGNNICKTSEMVAILPNIDISTYTGVGHSFSSMDKMKYQIKTYIEKVKNARDNRTVE